MEKEDFKRLITMLDAIYPASKSRPDFTVQANMLAWMEVLGEYQYDEVRTAALAHSRQCAFYPKVSELAILAEEEKARRRPVEHQGDHWWYHPGPRECASVQRLAAWGRDYLSRLRAAGLPTMTEAMEKGMTADQWGELVKDFDPRLGDV